MPEAPSTVLLFTRNGMGSTDVQELRERLAANFLRLLVQAGMLPNVICFYTDGVRLACRGSGVLEPLKEMEARGVRLVLCSTCLDTLGLRDEVRVGVVGGMPDIITALWGADKVIGL